MVQKVTRVSQQKRPGRYNIELDGEYALAVDEKILIQFDLFKGTEVDEVLLEAVQTAEYAQQAYQKGLVYATGQMRSRYQVYEKLLSLEFPRDVANQALDRLEDAKVIDDALFADMYISSVISTAKMGPRGAAFKLKTWGVQPDLIEDALVQFTADEQMDHLEQKIPALQQKYARSSQFMAQQKAQQFLLKQGYDQRLIQRAWDAAQAELEPDEEQEWENLNRDAWQVVQRYQQYEGWEFTKCVKASLYRKGYSFDLMDQWLKSYERGEFDVE